ncbi:MAG: hypothetical protein U5R49_27390 [Deltaproteobacteria bacterium]|nr:hypothetical protein [Deltaproteobacteria bacterium]
MSKKDINMRETKEYLSSEFPGMEIVPVETKGLMEDRPDQFFYGFQVGGKYFLAVIRATMEEEEVYPVLDGKNIADQMRKHPETYVVLVKGRTGTGTEVKIKELAT